MSDSKPAKVYLIGAGPGDPGLLTLRGAELIRRADVVLYDGLANQAVLEHARADARLICVGKHGHGGTWTQRQIDDEVVRLAKSGLSVARLKGGDTGVFARTAEEVERLIEESIPYEIVPGITAALAVSAYTGIPITHRDWSSAVALITGQLQATDANVDSEEPLDWNALAQFPGTLVLYMGVTTAKYWSSKLLEAGKLPSTPVALIRRCSWPDQQTIFTDLGSVAATIAELPNLRPPIISIVGDVVRMAKSTDWFGQRPWFGKRIWVTSPDQSGKTLSKKLEELGGQVLHHPVISIQGPEEWQSVDATLAQLDQYDWIVFSSLHGVDGFYQRLHTLGKDGRCLHRVKIAAVGTGTAAAISKYSMICDMIPQTHGAEALSQLLIPVCRNRRVLFVRNPEGETIAMDLLASHGAHVESLNIYRQVLSPSLSPSISALLQANQIDAITATSKNIARHTVSLLGQQSQQQTWLSLSQAVTQTLRELGCHNIRTARQATFDALTELVDD